MVFWAGISYLHFLFPANPLPFSLPHEVFEAATWPAYLAAYMALIFYASAHLSLWMKRGPFLVLYAVGAGFRLGVFIYHSFIPNFPSYTGFAIIAIDSAVIILAASGPIFSAQGKNRP